jgi:hypothetical protein
LSASALVVTDVDGWRFVEQNPVLKVAVAARPEIAEHPTHREGLAVIIPYAVGDAAGQYRGAAAREGGSSLILERPKVQDFERALSSIGVEDSDAKRLAATTGRSWSVFRRHRATNPALRRPALLDLPQARALSTLCLLGSWSAANPADREIVARVSGRPYEEIEHDLRHLAAVDDAPVIGIGEIWKAKSSLELLDIYGAFVTRGELERYLAVAKELLIVDDPQLQLPDEQRFAASIYGKVRAQSGTLIDGICDTLIKLAVRGPQNASLCAMGIEGRIAAFVRDLLDNASGERWLSLASYLPALAEAAPGEFLRSIDVSLGIVGAPVTRLIAETADSGIMGRCWHAGLLWALETLAWAPERLTRVVLILARLSHIEIKGNWSNTPAASLLGIFRAWLPQTAASSEQRLAGIDKLIETDSVAAYTLLQRLVNVGNDFAMPASRPHWRDDDAGAGHGVTDSEMRDVLVAIADRFVACSREEASRIAGLIESLEHLGKIDEIDRRDPPRVKTVLAIAEELLTKSACDEDLECVRAALRNRIHWLRNYGAEGNEAHEVLRALESSYERTVPRDLIVRHSWLFAKSWVDLPMCVREGGYADVMDLLTKERSEALKEILDSHGLFGVKDLAMACPQVGEVGAALARLETEGAPLVDWVVAVGGDFTSDNPLMMNLRGLLRTTGAPRSNTIVANVIEKGRTEGWDGSRIARFLSLAREERAIWEIATSCGPAVEEEYWRISNPGFWLRDNGDDFEFALHRLLAAHRPRTALQVCHMDSSKVDPDLLAQILEQMQQGEEREGPLPQPWYIAKAVECLEASGRLARDRLVRLEFGLIPALGYDGEHKAVALYNAMMSDPRLFVEVLALAHKPATVEGRIQATDSQKVAEDIAWRVLHHCRRLPGASGDGSIDSKEFVDFIEQVRTLAQGADRLTVCDVSLGQILAHAPSDTTGRWPCDPVRTLLDRIDFEDIRRGFRTGTMNRHGSTMRAYDAGGSQERDLAKMYRGHARFLQNSHPVVSTMLDEIARWFERNGIREDLEAKLRIEGR